MGVQTVIKEISLLEKMLQLSVAVYCDDYTVTSHAPRIELVFKNKADNRRMLMPVNSFELDRDSGKGVAYATYLFNLEPLFWNISWKQCQMSFDIDYEGTLYKKTPFSVEFYTADDSGKISFFKDHYQINLSQAIDRRKPKFPNLLQSVLSILMHLANMIMGLVLLPWFFLDVLSMLYLRTERLDRNVTGPKWKQIIQYTGWKYFSFGRNTAGITGLKRNFFKHSYFFFNALYPNKKGVLFLSNRRNDLTGNFEYVYNCMKKDKSTEISFWLHPETIREAGFGMSLDLARKAARAKVILVDDHIPLFDFWKINDKTKVCQLWHACGAFKTFGFSRLGKKGGPTQFNVSHRNYAYSFVSSKNIAKYYAEGFGVAEEKVVSFGIPRTDMFFDETAKQEITTRLYGNYPQLKGKKVIMFAPTFRGDGKNSAFYELQRFDPNALIESLPEDYILLIKHHPFVTLEYKIKEANKNRIFDFSKESEINELLFITDIMITDYSSVVYEASLLNIPMLFYAYDLENYVATRDFYSGFEHFVPGKIVRTEEEISQAILAGDFEHEKVQAFCENNFDIRDGRASERVAQFIIDLSKEA